MTQQPQLFYFYDPLCGWCYGFSPVIKKLKETYGHQIAFTAYCGGMAIGNQAMPIGKVYAYIKGALDQVTRTTGVSFGDRFKQDILEKKTYYYHSEPPCIAATIFKTLQPGYSIEFAHALQYAFFYEGKSLNELSTYLDIISPYGMDAHLFSEKFNDEESKRLTYEEFDFVGQLGVKSYPTVAYVKGNTGQVLSVGFQPYETLSKQLEALLA